MTTILGASGTNNGNLESSARASALRRSAMSINRGNPAKANKVREKPALRSSFAGALGSFEPRL
jgi:hypothetical protein